MRELTHLHQWLAWLETIHPKPIDLGLQRVRHVAHTLGVLNFKCPVITVAGTNGKGSCVALLASIYRAAGYRVGTYTSPHLQTYNERIQIDSQPVSDQHIIQAFTAINQARGSTTLTYFEFATLAALLIFQQAKLDVVLLEVGLGGRLDAVNSVNADVAVISSIDLDHQHWLGDSREAIGREKAGIFRAQQMAVVGDPQPPNSVVQRAESLGTQLYCVGRDFHYSTAVTQWQFVYDEIVLDLPLPRLLIQNAATAVMVCCLLSARLPVSQIALQTGVKVDLPGRLQQIPGDVPRIIDVAHNPQATQQLAKHLTEQNLNTGKVLAVWSMLADKAMVASLEPMAAMVDHWFVAPLTGYRAATLSVLTDNLEIAGGVAYTACTDVVTAYQTAMQQAQPGDVVVIFGSFYLVAQLLPII